MGARGRKSTAELSVVGESLVSAISRPGPPPELTDEQSGEWLAIVNRMPADWFPRETHGLLAQYCRHVVSARRIANLLEEMESSEDFDIEVYDRLLKMQEREGRALSSLATRMRVSQQAQYNHKRKAGKLVRKPWE